MKRLSLCSLFLSLMLSLSAAAAPLNISQIPLYITDNVPPMTMLVIGRDHKLYFEAYNDLTDVDGDGQIDLHFKPGVEYYGYFDSRKCYTYDAANQYFTPIAPATGGACPGSWSGNFLNYVTTSRLDAIRKALYGGYRSTDSTSTTVLERAYVPQDGHSFGKDYTSPGTDGFNISDYTPFTAPALNTHHLFANVTLRNGTTAPLLRVALNQPYRIWDWISIERPVADARALNGSTGPLILGITDYVVRVKVCDSSVGLESNCRTYPSGQHKPIGLLQEFGENNSMYFGLITGSYANNLQGGVLRKNISSITDEIDINTGQFTAVNGIISTLDKLTVTGFNTNYEYSCGFIATRNIVNGECEMWGNPIGEMMYEALRYLSGKGTPTPSFNYASGTDATLGLPNVTWSDPYASYPRCTKANILVISGEPSYDSDQVPGSFFNAFSGDLSPALNASALGQTIFSGEGLSSLLAYIGQSGSTSNGAPTPKPVTSFGNLRGLAPHEPNSEGSYYAASAAYYGRITDLSSAKGEQNALSYVVAFPSTQPELKFNVGGNIISLVPYAKSVSGFGINPAEGQYQPTNNVVDFFIESKTANQTIFRINFSDLQQGADYEMDASVRYTVTVNANNTLTVTLDSVSAAGSIIQHLGYVISGTTQDGLYLDVRDFDTAAANDPDYYLDTPPGQLPGGTWNDGIELPLSNTRTFTPSGVASASVLKSPLWYAAKWGGFTDSNGNHIPDLLTEYSASGSGEPDNYLLITNPASLILQMTQAFQSILDKTGSFASAALSSGFLATNTFIYQAIFQTANWSGQLLAFPIDPNTGNVVTTGSGPAGSQWNAGQVLNTQNFNTNRRILTYKPSLKVGIPFRWPSNEASPSNTELDLSQIAALNANPVTAVNDNLGSARLNFIRGDTAQEIENGGTFRDRTSLLGDIINSAPVVVGVPNQHYPVNWGSGAAENTVAYSAFRQANLNRQSIVYVGANDGLLHAFDGLTGVEVFGYVPSSVYHDLNQLTNPDYTHHYYVDGTATVIDVFFDSNWHTMLVGNLNAGGQGMYALDVTNPAQFQEANAANLVQWEFTDADDADMGYSFSRASIVRLANGEWAAIFGNGYNNTTADGIASTTGNAVLYIVNIKTGALIKKLDTKVGMSQDPQGLGRPNGLSTPVVVDMDGNSVADYVYAGDLFGNLWKIDLTSTNPSQWDFSYKQGAAPSPFFIAQDANGNRQPITIKPTVSRLTANFSGLQLYIGTGKYIEPGDRVDLSVQSVYALRDDNTTPISGRLALRQQTILDESNGARVVSDNLLANNDRGWYLDLIVNGIPRGERVVSDMLFLNGKLIFSTIIPTSDPCDFGGISWLMEVNAFNGTRLNYNVFDRNNDGLFNAGDSTTYSTGGTSVDVPVSGIQSTVGLISTPAILNAGDNEYKYLAGSSGGIQRVNENPGAQIQGRQSWRQLR